MPIAYQCRLCPHRAVQKWTFRCPGCGRFADTKKINTDMEGAQKAEPIDGVAISLGDVPLIDVERIPTGVEGFDRILGGGLVTTSAILLCGSPGAGKSTLLTSVLLNISAQLPTLYVSGEESLVDIRRRAERLGPLPTHFQGLAETDLDSILDQVEEVAPKVLVVDSIQMIEYDDYFYAGSALGMELALDTLRRFCKKEKIALIAIGHITKENEVAGPRKLEHLVDVTLSFETEEGGVRVLYCNKNRHGTAPAYARFLMTDSGLETLKDDEEAHDEAAS